MLIGTSFKPAWLREKPANRDRWMVSYMDIVTILLILFIAVSAQTFQNIARSGTMEAPRRQEPPRQAPVVRPEPSQSAELARAQERLRKRGLDLHMEPRGLVIALPQAILFASGEDRISTGAFPMIEEIAAVLRDVDNRVLLIGHADPVPIHNRHFHNNWELSAARSMRLLEMLTEQFGIPEARLGIASYGSHSPRASNETADGRAGNRRVEIVILGDSAGQEFR